MKNPWNLLKQAGREWTKSKFVGQSRQDKKAQEAFRKAIGKNKVVEVSKVQSSRYKYDGDDTIYDPNEIAKMDDGDISKEVQEVQADSTAVDSIRYDPETRVLTIKYQGGDTLYDFPNVPPSVVTEFMEAPSKGRYLAHYIMPNYSTNR